MNLKSNFPAPRGAKVRAFLLLLASAASSLIAFSCRSGNARPDPNVSASAQSQEAPSGPFLGFDSNIFPGKDALPVLRKTFAFAGYWLSAPPGATTNTWTGQRDIVRSQGFGFLLLYRGRLQRDLKNEPDAIAKGAQDAQDAAAAANGDGFPARSIIFLDIEEGGRLTPFYHSYIRASSQTLLSSGYRPGAYCSGMPVNEGQGVTIITADDIRAHSPSPEFAFFVFNDACPPSPGCVFPKNPLSPQTSGVPYASIWQLAQSPRRKEFTAHCPPGYHPDGNCYAPGDTAHAWFLDVSTASTPDPSSAR